jgi:hypothetical protein
MTQPFSTDDARRAGLSARQLQSKPWRRITRDVYVHIDVPDTLQTRARAIQLVAPRGAVASGRTAAWFYGADVLNQGELLVPEITLPRDAVMWPRSGVVIRRAELADADRDQVEGQQVTSAVRTAFDLSRRTGLREALVGLDAMLHTGLTSADEVLAYADTHPRWRGVRQVPRVVDLAEPATESPMESRLRYVIVVVGGLPRPQVQIWVPDEAGRPFARIDMGYEDARLGIEFDGQDHRDRWQADLERERRLRALGWDLARFVGADVYHRKHLIISTVHRSLDRAA